MNKEKIINNLVSFVEKKEKQLQVDKLTNDPQAKSDIVKAILDELERELENENK